MSSRWFNVLLGAFWLATMSWLVVAKVLLPLLRGDPPNYQTILPQAGRNRPHRSLGECTGVSGPSAARRAPSSAAWTA